MINYLRKNGNNHAWWILYIVYIIYKLKIEKHKFLRSSFQIFNETYFLVKVIGTYA